MQLITKHITGNSHENLKLCTTTILTSAGSQQQLLFSLQMITIILIINYWTSLSKISLMASRSIFATDILRKPSSLFVLLFSIIKRFITIYSKEQQAFPTDN